LVQIWSRSTPPHGGVRPFIKSQLASLPWKTPTERLSFVFNRGANWNLPIRHEALLHLLSKRDPNSHELRCELDRRQLRNPLTATTSGASAAANSSGTEPSPGLDLSIAATLGSLTCPPAPQGAPEPRGHLELDLYVWCRKLPC